MESFIEQLIELHTSLPSFRVIFESQQTTGIFISAYRAFVTAVAPLDINERTARLLEKLNHFGLALALDNAVAGNQKREARKVTKRTGPKVSLTKPVVLDP